MRGPTGRVTGNSGLGHGQREPDVRERPSERVQASSRIEVCGGLKKRKGKSRVKGAGICARMGRGPEGSAKGIWLSGAGRDRHILRVDKKKSSEGEGIRSAAGRR